METGDDCHRVLCRVERIEQRVGEAEQEQAANAAAMNGAGFGELRELFDFGVDDAQELVGALGRTGFDFRINRVDVVLGARRQADESTHLLARNSA